MALFIGQIIHNHYRIDEVLGKGGFGAVYRAWDQNLERAVAIKENLYATETAQRQFRNEALFLSRLSHPNLPRVFDHFILPGQGQYLVMEFVQGRDLAEYIQPTGPAVALEQALDWIAQTCDALTFLHTQDPPLIHRDIKPGNIRITPEGRAMLVDFGIAKAFDASHSTTVGARAVTPGFSPPEQYGQGKTDAQSDIYALGATLYALLTESVPLESIDIMVDPALAPHPVHLLNPQVPPALSLVVQKAMQTEKSRRWGSAAEFKTALLDAVHPATVQRTGTQPVELGWEKTQKVAPPRESSSAIKRWAWPAVVVVLLLALGYLLWPRTEPPRSATTTAPLPTVLTEDQAAVPPDSPTLPPLETEAVETAPVEIAIQPTDTPVIPTQPPTDIPVVVTLLSTEIPPTPTLPVSPRGTIAFHSNRGGNFDIYMIRADGEGLRQLTSGPSKEEYPSWSPDGRRLVFQSFADGDYDIYLMDVQTRETQNLTRNECADFAPTFAPTGNRIAYYSDCEGRREIFTLQLDGSEPARRTQTSGDAYSWYPFWSSGAEWIYFSSNRTGKYWIYRMRPSGEEQTQLVRGCSGVPSPADGRLVYQEFCTDQSSLFISNADGSGEEMILDGEQYDYRDPYWSPDGAWLVYRSNLNGDFDLFILNLLSREFRALTSGAGEDRAPSWTATEWP